MNRLPRIYRLLTREFEQSRHIIWVDEEGRIVTDVTFFILLLLDAAEGMMQKALTAWEKLVREAVERQLSGELLVAMDRYLKPYTEGLPEMPYVFFPEPQRRKAYGGTVHLLPLIDESDYVEMHGQADMPEKRTDIVMKRQSWTHPDPTERLCLRPENPDPTPSTHRTAHWLLAD